MISYDVNELIVGLESRGLLFVMKNFSQSRTARKVKNPGLPILEINLHQRFSEWQGCSILPETGCQAM